MQTLKEILRGLAEQFAVDGLEVLRRFSPQLGLFAVLVIPAVVGLVLYRRRLLRLGRAHKLLTRSLALNVAISCAVVGILLITLSARPSPENRVDLIPFHPLWSAITSTVDTTRVVVLFGANIVLFVPLGILLPLRWPGLDHPLGILLAGGLISASIETLQYVMEVGRVTQLDDVIFNAAGGLTGWAIQRAFRRTTAWLNPVRAGPSG